MNFHYIAKKSDGSIGEGNIEASNTNEALSILTSRDLQPISLKPVDGRGVLSRLPFGQKITVADKLFLIRYLSLMLKVGTDLWSAINILLDTFEKSAVKTVLLSIRNSLEKGRPFYSAFEEYPKYFSAVFVNLVKAGETSGNLERVLSELSVSLEKELELKRKIRAAITYPIILLVGSLMVMVFLVVFVLPRISKAFFSGTVEPPLFSRVVFGVGLFLSKYIFVILGVIAFVSVALWFYFSMTTKGRTLRSKILEKIPLIGGVLKKVALQRFASTLSSLLRSGVPIIDAFKITADAVGFSDFKEGLKRVADEGLAKGLTIGEALRKETAFPTVVVNLVAISEKAGRIDEVLSTLADFYESEIEASIKVLMSFLEPVLLVFIGAIVAVIALAIIIPIYQLVGQF